ncbi:MAG: hypothetical protein A3A33_03190 [Candidatus Yanofskybacteria bacterium RIFCSPLOWO2_01_FULL_49_25]|uniref:Water stress and hypersensitive response domain-containing protein n=1 Tax=Candidatus Yanofskybacteria bacterium RIFCSPLOWO2_01_FULL_49_25 TaxID=1802701 RepID=A0A1F8GTY7_9BACT|nr:MAG: hypothetical protein A3A33_03190 [Candidatus Yanofskybacteria bacterium RIFCSPLOWO2_01_FULL_49_25]
MKMKNLRLVLTLVTLGLGACSTPTGPDEVTFQVVNPSNIRVTSIVAKGVEIFGIKVSFSTSKNQLAAELSFDGIVIATSQKSSDGAEFQTRIVLDPGPHILGIRMLDGMRRLDAGPGYRMEVKTSPSVNWLIREIDTGRRVKIQAGELVLSVPVDEK